MQHVAHQNPDGLWTHFCTDCKSGLKEPQKSKHVVWLCKCKGKQTTTMPTLKLGERAKPQPIRIHFKVPKPKCAFLGAALGDPVKLSCGNQWQQPQECLCPSRIARIDRDGDPIPKLAADGWWCADLGVAYNDTKPRMYQLCQRCPFYEPQKLLQNLKDVCTDHA